MCDQKILCKNKDCDLCFNKSFASHEKSKYWSDKNGDITPRDIFKYSHQKFYFDCIKCNHSFDTIIKNITMLNRWCSYCANRKLCENNDCMICFNKSFASNEKSQYWNNDKNGDIKPRNVFKSIKSKFYFDCKECNHSFQSSLNQINNNSWCLYCANHKLCEKNDCKYCFNKSFASQEKSKYWSNKNDKIIPRQVFKKCGTKYWFNCFVCKHEFNTALSNLTDTNHWCPYCANQKLCKKDDCQLCFNKSFASNEKSKFWSNKNGDIIPRQIFKYSNNKYWFNCNICSKLFYSTLNGIVGQNRWCPYCVNKTEQKLYNKLSDIFPKIKHQFKAKWCKNLNTNHYLPFDFVLIEDKIIIELDGPQHFIQVSNWKNPEEQFKNDKYKENCANNNGFSTIRIIQTDVFYDKFDWFTEINNIIEKIKKDKIIQNIYICKNDEYSLFV
jgi:very-short-patch-repair endonuclease